MRHLALALSLFAASAAAPAPAHDMQLHASCSVNTDYDVDVRTDGILFTRADGAPREVFMHDGQLQVNGHALAVDPADTARLRQYEAQVRALLPEVAGIARDGVGIGFDALTTVAATFADSQAERARIIRQFAAQREQVLAEVDQGIGRGQWRRHGLDRMMEHNIGDVVSTLVSTVTARAVKAALSGDHSQTAALEARADSLEKSIDRAVKAPAERLEKRADALCPRLVALDQLQHQFTFRLPDGSPLSLLELKHDHRDAVADAHTP
jgi:murein L,D-transpeptidase YcbB/YkuD